MQFTDSPIICILCHASRPFIGPAFFAFLVDIYHVVQTQKTCVLWTYKKAKCCCILHNKCRMMAHIFASLYLWTLYTECAYLIDTIPQPHNYYMGWYYPGWCHPNRSTNTTLYMIRVIRTLCLMNTYKGTLSARSSLQFHHGVTVHIRSLSCKHGITSICCCILSYQASSSWSISYCIAAAPNEYDWEY